MPRLRVYRGREHLFNYYIESDEIVIGRSKEVEVPLDSEAVSRKHVRIFRRGATYIAEDLSQKNGMFINGRYIQQHFLKDGDSIEIAQHVIMFERADAEVVEERQRRARRDPGADFKMSHQRVIKALDRKAGRTKDVKSRLDGGQSTALVSPDQMAEIRKNLKVRRAAHVAFYDEGTRHEFALTAEDLVGWDEDCAIKLPGTKRFFKLAAAFVQTKDGYQVESMSVFRAVKLNGKRIKVADLKDKDTVVIAGWKLKYRAAVDADAKSDVISV